MKNEKSKSVSLCDASTMAVPKPDIRILTLMKQHYLDKYDRQIEDMYSCWGYYDAIIIQKVTSDHYSKLFEKSTNSPVSPIWGGIGASSLNLNGSFSQQNIGIFRYSLDSDVQTAFWEGNYKDCPYFAVGFLRLNPSDSPETEESGPAAIRTKIEANSVEEIINDSGVLQDSFCRILVYDTFDNADLVVLIKGNSLTLIEEKLHLIECIESVHYIHSLTGVSENFLSHCKNGILQQWNNMDCHIDDEIGAVELRIVTSGKTGTDSGLDKTVSLCASLLKKQKDRDGFGFTGLEKAVCSRLMGHESYSIYISNTDVRSILGMITENGICTHTSVLYKHNIINIETTVHFHVGTLEDVCNFSEVDESCETACPANPWCTSRILLYKTEMKKAWEQGREGLYACLCGLVQTLNTLSQYEGFSMSLDIFYILFPALDMFDRHLRKALEDAYCDPSNTTVKLDRLQDILCSFVTALNNVVYHTIHTDQVFLMVPGYAGSSYSIPISLCMLYLEMAWNIIEVLNDSGNDDRNKNEYKILLVPEMEVRPSSRLIDLGIDEENRLIRFDASQRSLYMPNYFLCILTHEIAHYVGDTVRNRENRKESLCRTISERIADLIINEYTDASEEKHNPVSDKHIPVSDTILEKCSSYYRNNISTACMKKLCEDIDLAAKNNVLTQVLHQKNLLPVLQNSCLQFIASEAQTICTDIDKEILDQITADTDLTYVHAIKQAGMYQSHLIQNCKRLLAGNTVLTEINDLTRLYSEIFSDVAAIMLLECDLETYNTAFDVSEGYATNIPEEQNPTNYYRFSLLQEIFNDKNSEKEPYSDYTLNYLYQYGRSCRMLLKRRLKENVISNYLSEVRSIYKLFSKNVSSVNLVDRVWSFFSTRRKNDPGFEPQIAAETIHYRERIRKYLSESISIIREAESLPTEPDMDTASVPVGNSACEMPADSKRQYT